MAAPAMNDDKGGLIALVIEAQQGNEKAFAGIIDATQSRLFKFCHYLSSDRQMAEDICQDTFVKALKQIGTLKDPATFTSWLFRIAKNLFFDEKRHARNREEEHTEDSQNESASLGHSPSPGPQVRDGELDVRAALAKLNEDERLVLLLVDVEEYSYQEAADIIKISENAMRSRVHRARKALLRFLNTEE